MGRLEKYNAISKRVQELEENLLSDVMPVQDIMSVDGIRIKKVPYNCRQTVLEDTADWDRFDPAAAWGEPDTHFCFHVVINIPETYKGKEVLFFLSTGAEDIWNTDNPQMLIYINGKRRCGMDMNHNSVTIYEKDDWNKGTDRQIDIRIYAYSNLAVDGNLLNMTIAARNEAVQKLYFDMKVPFEAMQTMLGIPSSKRESVLDTTAGAFEEQNKNNVISEDTFNAVENPDYKKDALFILEELYSAIEILTDLTSDGYLQSVEKASAYLRENLYGKNNSPVVVRSVGHTHIDVAWKWQIRQTREKVIRSYSTVMELMKKYPEYLFMASTPQMYEFVRAEEPELFDEIKEKVKEGRFEPEGAMWLEADCNLTSGESLVRQILYGKKYFKETFGVDSHILWLPDVFGYSGALPQILKKSGVKAFMTTKLAWNDTNRMPYDLFNWQGIDGSTIPTYIITTCDNQRADEAEKTGGILNYTYNGRQNASQTMGTWNAFREKSITNNVLTCYGYGDGGGGPTWEMLEMDRRMRLGIPGVPRTEQSSVTAFFDELLEKISSRTDVPVWKDELYLEYHRGTYTSIGKVKKNNRRAEYLMKEVELLALYASLKAGKEYPRGRILMLWKLIMLNQFHDILPGSSIEEVYKDSDLQYEEIFRECRDIIDESFVAIGGIESKEEAAGSGDIKVSEGSGGISIDTPFYEASFDRNGEITSLVHKETGRQVRHMSQHPLNRLIAFRDVPQEYDCWNIDADFEDTSWDITDVDKLEVTKPSGKEVAVHIRRNFRESVIEQVVHFYPDNRRIDFETKADWHEHQTLLKAAFPVDVDTDHITCEIQYGSLKRDIKRETSVQKAKFECCTHKWVDMSEDASDKSFGVALLNDCKYGYDAKENLMRLTLIKSGIFPNPNADQGEHIFTYSLIPHAGDYRAAEIIKEADRLNASSHLYFGKETPDKELSSKELQYRALQEISDSVISLTDAEGVFVEAVKMAEESGDIVVRLYEGHGRSHRVTAELFKGFTAKPKAVVNCDLLEEETDESDGMDYDQGTGKLSFEIKPFEIKTILVKS